MVRRCDSRGWLPEALATLLLMLVVVPETLGNHFRGGTISWRPTGNPNEVKMDFKLGWTYGRGPGCTEQKVGQLVRSSMVTTSFWQCVQGCSSVTKLADIAYYCKGANSAEQWEQGENSFTHTFTQGQGPYTVAFTGNAWITLEGGKGNGDWNLSTVVDLRPRSDSGQPNSSPISLSKPIYYKQFDCDHTIRIPVLDPDGDKVRCRLAVGKECASACNALPGMSLDEENCTVSFRPDAAHKYKQGGWYAVTLTVEDSPTSPITVGGQKYNPGDVLSSVPVQFLIKTPTSTQLCDWRPVFVNTTPAEGAQIVVKAGQTLDLDLYAKNFQNVAANVTSIQVLGPLGMTQGQLSPDDQGRAKVMRKHLTWTPTQADAGQHILCAIAEDDTRRSSEPRCFSIKAWDVDPCDSTPCLHASTCVRVGDVTYSCTCSPGYTDHLCGTDINECVSDPCQNSGTCVDQVNGYLCQCVPGYTDLRCQTDIDECASGPCDNGATCTDLINGYNCTCAPGFRGDNCENGTDHCASSPCLNNGACLNGFDGYTCSCPGSWTGINCGVLPVPGLTPVNATANAIPDWPNLEPEALSHHSACPRVAYSRCHCVIATNLHVPREEGSNFMRDVLDVLVGLPIGLALGVGSYLLFRHCCCTSTGSLLCRNSCCRHPRRPRPKPSVPSPQLWSALARWRARRPARVGSFPTLPPPSRESSVSEDVQGECRKSSAVVTNIYRATFGDHDLPATAEKKSPDTYTSARMDWSN